MLMRKLIAGLTVAAAATIGFAGVAGAQTPRTTSSSTPATSSAHQAKCAKAEALLSAAEKREDAVNASITQLGARIGKLQQSGHTKRADALTQRLDKVKDRLAKVEARVAKVQDRVEKVCGSSPGTATTPAS